MTDMVERSFKRPLTKKGYDEAGKELQDVDREIVNLRNRMSKAYKSVTYNKKTGKIEDVYDYDVDSLTDYERDRYYELQKR